MKLRIGSVDVVIGYEVVAAMTAVLTFDRENRVIACFFAAILHECGHLLMMRMFSCRVKSFRLRLFDVLIEAEEPKTRRADVFITLGGVAMNFLCCPLFFFFSKKIAAANFALGVFNLLPVESLDGGRLLSLLLARRLSPLVADRVLKLVSFAFLLPFFIGGIVILLRSKYNYSLLVISLYLLAVLILK